MGLRCKLRVMAITQCLRDVTFPLPHLHNGHHQLLSRGSKQDEHVQNQEGDHSKHALPSPPRR